MARFLVAGRAIDLPAIPVTRPAPSRDPSAWELGAYTTVQLVEPVDALRVHTDGRAYPGREASASAGAWLAIGDVVQTSSQLANSRSLPTDDPTSMIAFTHVSEVTVPENCILNIGFASAKFGGLGGGCQAEYVSGPAIRFTPLEGKRWHGRAGRA